MDFTTQVFNDQVIEGLRIGSVNALDTCITKIHFSFVKMQTLLQRSFFKLGVQLNVAAAHL